MNAPHLDKDRGFSLCLPAGEHNGASYQQDGNYFDHEGKFLFGKWTQEKGAAPVAPVEASAKHKPIPTNVGEVDLVAWVTGKAKYPWYAVRKTAAIAGYSAEDLTNAKAIAAAMVRSDIVRAEEVII